MVKGSEIPSDKVSANILDPDPWANCNNVADVLGHDWETQLDVATVRHFESLSALENPKQLPSSCCYGRGKRLGDIVVPRLPNLLEEEQFAVTPLGIRDENWQRALQNNAIGRHQSVGGRGRGKMLRDQASSLDAEMVGQRMLAATETPSSVTSSTKCTPVSSSSRKSSSLLFGGESDFQLCAEPSKPSTFNVSSSEDFPDLSLKSSACSSPPFSSSKKHKKGKERTVRLASKDTVPSGAFGDADECAVTLDSLAKHVSGNLGHPGLHPACDENQVYLSSTLEHEFADSCDIRVENTPEDSNVSESKRNSKCERSVTSVSGSSSCDLQPQQVVNVGEIDDACLKDVEALPRAAEHTNNAASAGAESLSQPTVKDNDSEGNKDGGPGTDRPGKIKKKSATGWKLDGPLVVQVENVPKNCGGELQTHMNTFGKVVDSEKKSRKGGNVWRFRFESIDTCHYVVECLHGAELFEGCSTGLQCYCLGQDTEDGTPV